MRILWTDEALDDLEEILAYYYLEASPRTAAAVERRIIAEVESLPPYPERIRESERVPGARELVLDNRGLAITRVTDADGRELPFEVGTAKEGMGAPLTIAIGPGPAQRRIAIQYSAAPGAEACAARYREG